MTEVMIKLNGFNISRIKAETLVRPKRSLNDLPLPPVLPAVSKPVVEPIKTPPLSFDKEHPRRKRPKYSFFINKSSTCVF